MKRFLSICAAAALAVATLSAPAWADENVQEPVSAPESTEQVQSDPEPVIVDESPAPAVEEAQPAPVVEEQVAPEARKTEPEHIETTFCHKPGEDNQKTLTTDDDGFLQGHLGHGDTLGACAALPEVVTEWHTWASPKWFEGLSGHVGAPNDAWNQTYVGAGQIAPTACEVTYQQDKYTGTRAQIDAVLADQVLTGPNPYEDAALVKDWTFVSSEACPVIPPVVAPKACTAVGDWYTEDIAPTLTNDGLLFTGSTPKPVNYLHPVTGNIQGLAGGTYTLADVAGYQTAYRIVVNPNAGSLHYASVTVEPYMNGWTAGQSGTFAVTPASLAWSSKIPTGPGSQSEPVALSQFGTIWPDNALISVGFHLGSTNDASTHSLITAVTGNCLTASFQRVVPEQPEPRVSTNSWDVTTCVEPLNGTATITTYAVDTTYPVTFDTESWTWVEGEGVAGEQYIADEQTVDAQECAVVVTPTPTPTPTETPSATPTVTTTPSAAPVVSQVASPAALASTGSNGIMWIAFIATLLIVAGCVIFLLTRKVGEPVRHSRR